MQEITDDKNLKNKLLLIDGHNLLFQMFFGMPARIKGKNGKAVQGVLGFVGAILKMIKTINPTHILVIFDGEHKNERLEINCDYKANRPNYSELDENQNPFSQLEGIYNALDYLKIKRFECPDCECDDLIASYAKNVGKTEQTVICSYDSDFFQLITDKVTVFRYKGDSSVICDKQYLAQKFEITPEQYADFKSLTGDSADNVKGADKIGPKTASKLINEYFTLENLLKNIDKINRPCIKNSLKQSAEKLKNNYKIIKLTNQAKLPFSMQELMYEKPQTNASAVLKAIGLF